MTNFEKTVRPFETRDVRPGKPVPSAENEQDVENVVLVFGENGSGKTFNGNFSFNRTSYQDKTPRELFGHGQQISFQFPPITFP